MVLTFGELKTAISNRIRDPGYGNITEAYIETEINAVVRKLAKHEDICQATITFSLASGTVDGVITSNTTNYVFPITYYNMDGYPSYIIGQGVRLLDAARHIDAADGTKTELLPADKTMIDNRNLRDTGYSRFSHYEVVKSDDLRLRFYPQVRSGSYPHKFEIAFVYLPADMTDDADELQLPESHADIVVPRVCEILENVLGRPERVQMNRTEALEEIGDAREDNVRRGRAKPQRIAKTWRRIS
jgi:hypothetical protein